MLRIVLESIAFVLALCLGWMAFRYMTAFCKVVFFQLISAIFFYIGSLLVIEYQRYKGDTLNNLWWYNLGIPIETGFTAVSAWLFFKGKRFVFLIPLGYAVFLTVYVYQLVTADLYTFFHLADVSESILTSFFSLIALYSLFHTKEKKWWQWPETWILIGFIIYFACSVPYFSVYNYLLETNPKMSRFLFFIINSALYNIRYLCLALAFWMIRQQALKIVKSHA